MKHPPISLSLTALASCLFLHSARADITVNNPGLEGSLSPWVYSASGAVYSTTNAHSGAGCVQLTGSASGHPSILQTIHGLQPNTAYKLEAYGKVGTAPSSTFGVSGYGGSSLSALVTSTTYQRIVIPFTTGASNTTATISYGVGTGTAYGDDFAVVPANPPPVVNTDPSNTAGWVLNDNLSDEFSGATLDPSRWHAYLSYWPGGAFPWQSFTSNTSVSGGVMHLLTNNYNLLPNGNFETNSFANWTTTGTCAIGQYYAGEAEEHDYGAKLTGAANVRQLVSGLSPNTQYTLAGVFKIGTGGTQISLSADTFGGTPVSPAVLNSTDSDAKDKKSGAYVFVVRSVTFTTGPSSTSAVVTITNSGAAGVVYADEVSLVLTSVGLKPGNSFSTGSMESLTKPQYGYYEARMKAAAGANVCAFWFWNYPEAGSGEKQDEIDVCELVGAPQRDPSGYPNYQDRMPITTHYFPGDGQNFYNNTRPLVNVDVSAAFHTYGVDWEPDSIKFYFDGALMANFPQVQPPAVPTGNNQTQVRWLDWLTFDTEIYTVYGSPTGTTDFQIDYVRAWTK